MNFSKITCLSRWLLLGSVLLPGVCLADEQTLNSANTGWIMASTALVLFMTLPGLAMFYGGLVRAKNVLSVLMQCFAIAGMVSILWLIAGYSLAFGEGNAWLGDFSKVLMASISKDTLFGDIPESLFMLFQMTFAIITPALIVGGFAERMRFSAMLLFSAIWLMLVYVPVTHWVWGGGWLGEMGLYDFAGGTVVHITAGVAALVAAMMMGPRGGFGTSSMMPHNMTMTITGAGMLWVGWFGFNGGSALAADGNASMAMLVTHISAATGAMTWLVREWIKFGKPSALGAVTGMVAGLGTITPASGFVSPSGALVIGLLAGIVCFSATNYLKQVLKIDDSLDVFPVHGVGGILGTLLAGIFSSTSLGLFSGYGFAEGIETMGGQLYVQFIGVIATIAFTVVATFAILKLVDLLLGLRVNHEQEIEGLDIVLHEERGYNEIT
ncbi:MAG: ammonium transporter [Candidatus Thiodiazotropha sp. (ex Lucinoma aequizonata)]|nr:ammonium transporter [Candidatus Thiodiazotropha sp. (ex Lucinoma aequizonata)]MCU7889005.1 ammonium transporter [Candidatus Thiodiazotropha sp. (ex Lucinoma aequizonata)]MCU7894106.1 ammonium transporter [Candidatus Thiodiazotropha sp. (ex Lucinoma aequizonata)]MCU7898778.1 ammonium transporter [Candidatus Thiodiazotropha sp. (ex Lucinoma aequizonata)]MCU7903467.1 ammonium transporter [Candidatus Thiodiazotropha sp. (ex Lucinoma aequizonata)]